MLQFILGKCGSGKSKTITDMIKNKIKSGKKTILIVPEQSSFENEKKMLKVLGNNDFNKMEVLSFSRLYDFVSKKLGIPALPAPEDTTKIVTMNCALERARKNLSLYKKNYADSAVADLMLRTAEEFKAHKINFEQLNKIQQLDFHDTLKQKISEIKIIINSYEELTKNKFEDSLDNLNKLENIITKNKVFEEFEIFFDEFSSFTPQQSSILKIILAQAKNVYMAFCFDDSIQNYDEKNLFFNVYQTLKKIQKDARSNSVEISEPIVLRENLKFSKNDLLILQENIFCPEKSSDEIVPQNIEVYNALSQSEECEYVARNIIKTVMTKNFRFKDFAIIARNIENYKNTLKSTFKKYDIPYFLNSPNTIFHKSIMNLIFSALDAAASEFDSGEIFRFLKSGLVDLSTEEISIVENYVFLWNITGHSWCEDFTMHPKGFEKAWDEESKNELENINELRKKIISPLKNFYDKTKRTTADKISKSLYELILDVNAAENLRNLCKNLAKSNKSAEAQCESGAWDCAMDILGKISEIFQNTKISVKKYADILRSVSGSVTVSTIPQSLDNVVIGQADTIRLSSVKTVFLLGAINGEFPKTPDSSAIFTESEINFMTSLGVEIADNAKTFLIQERFLAYMAISNASEKLFVSWPSSSLSGKGNIPSEIIKEIVRIFPKIKIKNRYTSGLKEKIWKQKPSFEILARNLGKNSSFSNELKKYYIKNESYKEKYKALEKIFLNNPLDFENPKRAEKFFGKQIKLSASQIEKYYTCRFGYFCQYALGAKPLKKASFGAIEYGNIIHYSLEKLFKKYPNDKIVSAPEEEIQAAIESITKDYTEKNLGGIDGKPQRFLHGIKKLNSSLVFLAKYFVKEFEQSSFALSDLELEIAENGDIPPLKINMPNGTVVTVEGKIDRVDIMKSQRGTYVRIVDYKTGIKEFKLSDVLFGLNMQMLIYLTAVKKNGERKYGKIIPAGMLYFTALKPVIDAIETESSQSETTKIFEKLCMNGLLLDDTESILGMEKDGKGIFIPAEIKNGEIKKSQSTINSEELRLISNYSQKLITEMVNCLQYGKVSAKPILKGYTACERCSYLPICCYEKEIFSEIPTNMTNKKALEKIIEKDDQKHEQKMDT